MTAAALLLIAGLGWQPVIIIQAPIVRHWALLYREFDTEFLGCLYGVVRPGRGLDRDTVMVLADLPSDIRPSESRALGVRNHCAPGPGFLGTVHSHPGPVTAALCGFSRADEQQFLASGALLDVLVCGYGSYVVQVQGGEGASRCIYDPEAEAPQCREDP